MSTWSPPRAAISARDSGASGAAKVSFHRGSDSRADLAAPVAGSLLIVHPVKTQKVPSQIPQSFIIAAGQGAWARTVNLAIHLAVSPPSCGMMPPLREGSD